ncbi:MAG: hypothetical protein IPK97_18625 [Ahniella sp.]|nr:hypothetical protein [Ahniella sp.]
MAQETGTDHPPRDFGRWRDLVWPIVLALVATFAVVDDLILSGPMAWHLRQPAVLQGGLEAILFGVVAMGCAWRGSRTAWFVLIVAACFYLRRHHVDLPLICALLTAETLVSLGLVMIRDNRIGDHGWRLAKALCAGACLWWLLMLAIHGFRLGSPDNLLLVFALVAAGSFAWRRQSVLLMPGLRTFAALAPLQRAVVALIGVYLLVQLARSNAVIGYDTLWYLARGQSVLAPNGSLFEPLGLVSAVHYAPKLFEAWLLPWEAAHDLSFQFAQSLVFVCAAGFLAADLFARAGMPKGWRPVAVLALLSLPAIGATALQLKNDVVAWYLVLLGLVAALRWLESGRFGDLCWVIGASLLACSAKLTVLPMIAAIILVMLIVACFRGKTWLFNVTRETGDGWFLGFSIVICFAMLFRTWWLCGLPTIGPEPLVAIWRFLGFELTPPAGSLKWLWPQDWSDAPWLLPEALFRPDDLPKIRIAWTGHVWLLCGMLALFWRRLPPVVATPAVSQSGWLLWPLAFLGLVLLMAWRYETRGADGNYYLIPVTAAVVLGLSAATRVCVTRAQKLGLSSLLMMGIGLQVTLTFLSAGWSPLGPGRSILTSAGRLSTPPSVCGRNANRCNWMKSMRCCPACPRPPELWWWGRVRLRTCCRPGWRRLRTLRSRGRSTLPTARDSTNSCG